MQIYANPWPKTKQHPHRTWTRLYWSHNPLPPLREVQLPPAVANGARDAILCHCFLHNLHLEEAEAEAEAAGGAAEEDG